MAKGFTLLELSLVLMITAITVAAGLPALNRQMAMIQLKQNSATLVSYVQSARALASSTECQARLGLKPLGKEQVQLMLELENDPLLKGCALWFETTNGPNTRQVKIAEKTIDSLTINRPLTLLFQGISGSLKAESASTIELSSRGVHAHITLDGIGNGVLRYVE
ncbi:Tfp pilus assembly protein FimT/FimU [Limnobacter sp.]|uniref:pilus assembly FimT family protein n=1 Tax=Limnobacter sp. TaxID=2003368 RepID=UPI0035145E77